MAARKTGTGTSGSSSSKKTNSTSRSKASERTPTGRNTRSRTAETRKKKKDTKDRIWAILLICFGIFLVFSMHTSMTGKFGDVLQEILKGCFGLAAFLLPYYIILYGLLLITKQMAHISLGSVFLLMVIYLCLAIFNSARYITTFDIPFGGYFLKETYELGTVLQAGGVIGMSFAYWLNRFLGIIGLCLVCSAVLVICFMLVADTPVSKLIDKIQERRDLRGLTDDEEDEEEEEIEPVKPKEKQVKKKTNKKDKDVEPVYNADAGVQLALPETDVSEGNIASKMIGAASLFKGGMSALSDKKQQILDLMNAEDAVGSEDEKKTGEQAKDCDISVSDLSDLADIPDAAADTHHDPSYDTPAEDEIIETHDEESNAEALPEPVPKKEYKLPPVSLLHKAKAVAVKDDEQQLKLNAAKLEAVLENFGVSAEVVDAKKGPAVTKYELRPAIGVKVNSITRLENDIALNMKAQSIRIEAPIPGKAAVGIEIQNEASTMVSLREMVESPEFKEAKSKISFVVGKDVSGNCVVKDLKEMPHLLIAGSTGSGKSVCINSLLMSILYRAKPEEVRFILVDPKVVELGNYNGIPHMLIPVVTEPAKAAAALGWAVQEMNERYFKFAENGARDLATYNTKMKKTSPGDIMPQIVIVIDELADLMMAAPRQVESYICMLAQKARAAGMHLILATQRPSVDIITGVIKANVPSRIAFAVSSGVDSRTILDTVGAEKLLGKGDMLFHPLGLSKPIRLQGPFVSDDEVNSVIDYWKAQAGDSVEYNNDILEHMEKAKIEKGVSVTVSGSEESSSSGDDEDDLLKEAIESVIDAQQASASMLQRRFRVGYNRAARLIDIMEERGIIGASEGAKPRKVLISKEEWYMRNAAADAEDHMPENEEAVINEDIH